MEIVLKYLKIIGNFLLDILLRIVFVFRDLGLAIWHGILGVKNFFLKFVKRFREGNKWTKVSHFVMGAGNFANKQYVKGSIFLLIEVIFVAFMIASPRFRDIPLGTEGIVNFFTLGEYHGMQINPDFNFNDEYIGINTELDLHNAVYDDYESKAFRVKNVIESLGEKDVIVKENDESLTYVNEEKVKVPYYYSSDYNSIIEDHRAEGVVDVYGYNHAMVSELRRGLQVYKNDLIWLISKQEIDFSNINEQIVIKSGNNLVENLDINVFKHKEEVDSDGNAQYTYLIFNLTNSRNQKMYFNGIDENIEVMTISYHPELINNKVDNSYLMMLFGIVTFAIVAIFIIIYNVSIASAYKAEKDVLQGKMPSTFIEDLKSLLDSRFHMTLLTPALIFLVVFTIVPTLLMILISFTDLSSTPGIQGTALISWTGFENFVNLFSGDSGSEIANNVGKYFGPVITWTFEWAIIATFSCYFGGIFLAILINKKDIKFKKIWRTIFILTIAIPQFISLIIMTQMLNLLGPVNQMLIDLGIIEKGIDFLQQATASAALDDFGSIWLARGTVLLINLYIGIPYTMLMTSGILMNIPKDLYEAATIDGANKWQMFRKITLPYVIFVTTPYLISSFIGNITSFNTIFLTTGGGPNFQGNETVGHTDLLVTWLYKLTIDRDNYNAGSIIGILTFVITAFITLVCYRNSKAYKEEDTFQ